MRHFGSGANPDSLQNNLSKIQPEVRRQLFRARTVTDGLREELDPRPRAPVAVVPVQQLQVGRQECEAVVRPQDLLPDLVKLSDEHAGVHSEGLQGSDEVLLLPEEAGVVDDGPVVVFVIKVCIFNIYTLQKTVTIGLVEFCG